MMKLDARYWQRRYEEGNTPWDIGYPSPALIQYFEQLPDRSIRILIPGAGFGHEAAWLMEHGFIHTFICEWASLAVAGFLSTYPSFPSENLITNDFFKLDGTYDLIIEQTFLSAIEPERWGLYAQHCHQLLQPDGILAGLLFAQPFDQAGPPFGATKKEYTALLTPWFDEIKFTPCAHSIGPRAGRELFLEATKRV
ncbi:MAG: SAM-dependent methyltransferase [Saprospiraceae bacterium]|nr:SAM-dependent methyltransferase [Saprospiraceae bacterium]